MEESECMICIENPGTLRFCGEKHRFCRACFQEWVKQTMMGGASHFISITCPCCRTGLTLRVDEVEEPIRLTFNEYVKRFEEIFWSGFTGPVSYEHPLYGESPHLYPAEIQLSFLEGMRDGVYREFGPSGLVLREDHYTAGTLHGHTFIYRDGYTMEYEYVQGVRNGPAVHKDPTGLVTWEGTYVDGEPDGLFVSRSRNGSYMETPYLRGVYHGHWLYWKKKEEGDGVYLHQDVLYEHGERHGPTKTFNARGELIGEVEYLRGKIPLQEDEGEGESKGSRIKMVTREKYMEIYPERHGWI